MSESRAKGSEPGILQPGPIAGVFIAAGLVLAAFNLRPLVTSVGPVLEEIRASTGMSATLSSITTVPMVSFSFQRGSSHRNVNAFA